jgi:hypothetical protein
MLKANELVSCMGGQSFAHPEHRDDRLDVKQLRELKL